MFMFCFEIVGRTTYSIGHPDPSFALLRLGIFVVMMSFRHYLYNEARFLKRWFLRSCVAD